MKDWKDSQSNSGEILGAGLQVLSAQPEQPAGFISSGSPGVYLICFEGLPQYAGEAKALSSRIQQQFSSSSTFYRNYLKYNGDDLPKGLQINDFSVRSIRADIGRKELEEFAIVELDLILNKAMGRRDNHTRIQSDDLEVWNRFQSSAPQLLSDGSSQFMEGPGVPWESYRASDVPGVYRVHGDNGALLYIGESSNLNRRHGNHSKNSRSSALRRHIGTELLGLKFERKMTLSKAGEDLVNSFLSSCTVFGQALPFGRYELENKLIKEQNPLLNRKDKK